MNNLQITLPKGRNVDTSGLSESQKDAANIILTAFDRADDVVMLTGGPGTGKTYLLRHILDMYSGRAIITAPTNKATKVLKNTLTTDDYTPQCVTTYSLLGMRMTANGELRELIQPDVDIDLSRYRLVVVDEASMVNTQLMECLLAAKSVHNFDLFLVCDKDQIPPVNEDTCPIIDWVNVLKEKGKGTVTDLTDIIRFDTTIGEVVKEVRDMLHSGGLFHMPSLEKYKGHGKHTASVLSAQASFNLIDSFATSGEFLKRDSVKIIAWRNKTVAAYNQRVRQFLFPQNHTTMYLPEDRITLLSPAMDGEGKTKATTDDEGTVQLVIGGFHPTYTDIATSDIQVCMDDNQVKTFKVVAQEGEKAYENTKRDKFIRAKSDSKLWKHYWNFIEAFHYIRHAYAITVHKSQGSTYKNVIVDLQDILMNRNQVERIKCLYVAVSRASKQLYIKK